MLHRYDTYLDGSFGTHILFLKILLDADNNLLADFIINLAIWK
ncbi:hypothetical protein NUITMVRE12_26030 [Enterococcus faecium]|nr:hypothetical protein NUITMVRE12_26030 [Enterococcus faecium]